MQTTCANCGKTFQAKRKTAKFCSDECRVAFNRNTNEASKKGATPPESQLQAKAKAKNEATPTDKLFSEESPGYYQFEGEVFSRKCFTCDKSFGTRLSLNQFCSPSCKQLVLKKIAGVPQ